MREKTRILDRELHEMVVWRWWVLMLMCVSLFHYLSAFNISAEFKVG